MNFVGIDLHKKTISLCVVDQERQVLNRQRFYCDNQERIMAFFEGIRPFQAVVEATASYEWLVGLIEPLADRVLPAHPKRMRIIAESSRKSDKLDAQVLAEFLALDMIPEAYRPAKRERAHRILVRQRSYLSRRVTSVPGSENRRVEAGSWASPRRAQGRCVGYWCRRRGGWYTAPFAGGASSRDSANGGGKRRRSSRSPGVCCV